MDDQNENDRAIATDLSAEFMLGDDDENPAMPPEHNTIAAPASSSEIITLTQAILCLTQKLSNQETDQKRAAEMPRECQVPAKRSASLPSEAIQDGEGDCDEIINCMLHANDDIDEAASEEKADDLTSDDEVLNELLKEYDSEDVPGEQLQSAQLAKLVNKMFRTKMGDQAVKDKLARQTRPGNCENAIATWVNPGIWRRLRDFRKKRDLQLFRLQQVLVKSILPVTRLVDISMSDKSLDAEKTQALKRHGLDALSLLTHVN